jgi:hypothetical protein
MRSYFPKDIDLYGGRKGFTDLMLSRGNRIENISIRMGQSTLDRTWRSISKNRSLIFRRLLIAIDLQKNMSYFLSK